MAGLWENQSNVLHTHTHEEPTKHTHTPLQVQQFSLTDVPVPVDQASLSSRPHATPSCLHSNAEPASSPHTLAWQAFIPAIDEINRERSDLLNACTACKRLTNTNARHTRARKPELMYPGRARALGLLTASGNWFEHAGANDHFGSLENVPTHAATIGLGTVLRAKEICLCVVGEGKAELLARALAWPCDSVHTCQFCSAGIQGDCLFGHGSRV